MLKFFRKIRRKLITEWNLKKYLVYAIGEIFLVIVGILIALEFNNSNNERELRNKEYVLLLEVRDNLQANSPATLLKNQEFLNIISQRRRFKWIAISSNRWSTGATKSVIKVIDEHLKALHK